VSDAESVSRLSAAYSLLDNDKRKSTVQDRAGFWTLLAVFQVVFGAGVFAITRYYYRADATAVSSANVSQLSAVQPWPQPLAGTGLALPGSATPAAALTDPAGISRLADEAYSARQYDRAAELYERLLTFDPANVDVRNNLGIALHNAGRSEEALEKLSAGVTRDPLHQRSWLTLGFINSQLGNVEDARTALTNAMQTGTDEQIRSSAQTMLGGLPVPQ
jgi:predicted Zn-dependent protease